jgi:uncharacterized protein (DUF608 family)
MPLGTLGTGAVEICGDGRFRNLTINNNRTSTSRIPLVPHSFLAVSARNGADVYLRRLQRVEPGRSDGPCLPHDGLRFRASYPLADYRVHEPGAPVDVIWSAFAPVVPYDYDASALPLICLGIQVTNVTEVALEVSALLNWQNTCGYCAFSAPEHLAPIIGETLITQGDWDRMKGHASGDNERRLSSQTGQMESQQAADIRPGDIAPNALVFGDLNTVDTNEDGQYCVATPWVPGVRTTLHLWDPEQAEEADAFWRQLVSEGGFGAATLARQGTPRCGTVCNQFRLEPGESRHVEFAVSWYCPRYVVNGIAEGNFYANNHADARAVARTGLTNSKYYFAAIKSWQQRLVSSDLPAPFVKQLLTGCEVLSTNSIHTATGEFGLFECANDTRVNYLRDRWFWSMGLLLFYPRLELDILDRLSQRMVDESGAAFRISEGLEGFGAGEFVPPGAAQVEACAHLVIMTWRNFLFGGNLSFLTRMVPRLQSNLSVIIAQDKDFDGFPDLHHEAPGLDCAFARGLNVITAGLWLVALAAGERMARRQKLAEATVYKQALSRATQSFERYYWNSELGYYTFYPDPKFKMAADTELQRACHVGQLHAIWIASFLGLESVFPSGHARRALEAVESRNVAAGRVTMLTVPEAALAVQPPGDESVAITAYSALRITCCKQQRATEVALSDLLGATEREGASAPGRHVCDLGLWYLVAGAPAARLDLADKRLMLRPDPNLRGQRKDYTLYTPNGFGSISISLAASDTLQCQVDFRMDIPQELHSIVLVLPPGAGEVQCRLELEDGPVSVNVNCFPSDEQRRVEIYPDTRLAVSAFVLALQDVGETGDSAPSKSQWIPRWLRR